MPVRLDRVTITLWRGPVELPWDSRVQLVEEMSSFEGTEQVVLCEEATFGRLDEVGPGEGVQHPAGRSYASVGERRDGGHADAGAGMQAEQPECLGGLLR